MLSVLASVLTALSDCHWWLSENRFSIIIPNRPPLNAHPAPFLKSVASKHDSLITNFISCSTLPKSISDDRGTVACMCLYIKPFVCVALHLFHSLFRPK